MEGLMRHWKLLAFKYKRETSKIHEQLAEILVKMNPEEIKKQQIVTGIWNKDGTMVFNFGTILNYIEIDWY